MIIYYIIPIFLPKTVYWVVLSKNTNDKVKKSLAQGLFFDLFAKTFLQTYSFIKNKVSGYRVFIRTKISLS